MVYLIVKPRSGPQVGADNTRGATITGAEETTLYRTSFVRRNICMRSVEYGVQTRSFYLNTAGG